MKDDKRLAKKTGKHNRPGQSTNGPSASERQAQENTAWENFSSLWEPDPNNAHEIGLFPSLGFLNVNLNQRERSSAGTQEMGGQGIEGNGNPSGRARWDGASLLETMGRGNSIVGVDHSQPRKRKIEPDTWRENPIRNTIQPSIQDFQKKLQLIKNSKANEQPNQITRPFFNKDPFKNPIQSLFGQSLSQPSNSNTFFSPNLSFFGTANSLEGGMVDEMKNNRIFDLADKRSKYALGEGKKWDQGKNQKDESGLWGNIFSMQSKTQQNFKPEIKMKPLFQYPNTPTPLIFESPNSIELWPQQKFQLPIIPNSPNPIPETSSFQSPFPQTDYKFTIQILNSQPQSSTPTPIPQQTPFQKITQSFLTLFQLSLLDNASPIKNTFKQNLKQFNFENQQYSEDQYLEAFDIALEYLRENGQECLDFGLLKEEMGLLEEEIYWNGRIENAFGRLQGMMEKKVGEQAWEIRRIEEENERIALEVEKYAKLFNEQMEKKKKTSCKESLSSKIQRIQKQIQQFEKLQNKNVTEDKIETEQESLMAQMFYIDHILDRAMAAMSIFKI